MKRMLAHQGRAIAIDFVGDPSAARHGCTRLKAEDVLPEDVLYFSKQSASLRLVFDPESTVEFVQQLFLALGELGRSLHTDLDVQVTLSVPVQHRYPLAPHSECRPRLDSLRHLQCVLALKRRHLDFRAQRSLRERDRNLAMKVHAFTFEERMILHMKYDI